MSGIVIMKVHPDAKLWLLPGSLLSFGHPAHKSSMPPMIPNPNLTERLQRKQRGCQQFHFVPPLLVLPYSNNILHHYLIFVSKGSHLVYMRKDFHMLSNGSNRKQCKRENAFSVRREGYQVSRSAGTRQFPLPNIKRTERTLEKQFAVNAHPT